MKEISFFADLFDLFAFFIPGALIMFLLYPLAAPALSRARSVGPWKSIKDAPSWITGMLMVMAAISIGVLLRTPSAQIQLHARGRLASTALFQAAESAVITHFGSSVPQDPDSLRAMVATVADEASVAPDNERFNRMLLFTRGMGTACGAVAVVNLVWWLIAIGSSVTRRNLRQTRSPGSPSPRFVLISMVVNSIVGAAFCWTYWDLQERSMEAVATQCLLALHPLPKAKQVVDAPPVPVELTGSQSAAAHR